MVPATGPYVSPMRNSAPGLLQQTGQTLAKAGETLQSVGNTIGDRVQETMDDAQTKAAENQFLQASLPMLGQYRTTEGINATQQFDPTAQSISKARQDARATLANPIQQRMFDQVTNDHMLSFGQQMADHENGQRVQYGKDQAGARVDNLNMLAVQARLGGDMAGYQKYAGQADDETKTVAQLSGNDPSSPAADAMLRVKRSALATGIVSGYLDKHAYNEASQYFDSVKDDLDLTTADRLGGAVKAVMHQEAPKDYVQKAVMAALGQTGPGVLQPPIAAATISTTQGANGIDLHTAAGTPVRAPASGTVTKIGTNPQQGNFAQVALPNGYVATFGGLGAVNYQEGQKITIGQVLGTSGKDDSGQGVVNYSMTDADGKQIDPRQASGAPMDPKNFNTAAQEDKAISWLNANVADPEDRQLAVTGVHRLADENLAMMSQQHAAALKQATDYWFQNGQSITNLPADIKLQLKPEDMLGFAQKRAEIDRLRLEPAQNAEEAFRLGQDERDRTQVGILGNWIEHPEQQTVDAVRQAYAQGKLSDEGFQSALRGAMAIQENPEKADGNKVISANVEKEQIDNTLLQNGRPTLVDAKAGSDEQRQRVALQGEIQDQIDAEQQATKRELTRDQKQTIIDSVVMNNRFLNVPGTLWRSNPSAPWELTPKTTATAQFTSSTGKTVNYEPIPVPARAAAVRSLIQRQLPVNERNIYDTWVNSGMGK